MRVTQVVTSLEMTSLDQLRTAQPCRESLELIATTDAALIREVHDRVAAPHHWSSLTWDDARWLEELSRTDLRHWLACTSRRPVGLLSLGMPADSDFEIETFGLVPELVGRGLGGMFLTKSVQLAWDSGAVRLWLHTSSLDHPNALRNYKARGFRVISTERRQREIPDQAAL